MNADELVYTSARKLAALIRARKVSATEVMRAFIARIERVNPKLNAIVTFLPEQALKAAKALDRKLARGREVAFPLFAGLPVAYKDNVATAGIRTTNGSPVFRDNVPKENHVLVDRLTAAGAITLGKTNLPEFAAGSHTFNTVFGATLNPYDTTRSAGGFCNVIGFRPTPGRVPNFPYGNAWSTLGTLGPIGRTASDAAFLLSVMAGPDPRAPTSFAESGSIFNKPLKRSFRKLRVAWSRNLGGLPMDPRVTAVLEKQRKAFTDLGCIVEEAEPDFSGAAETFETLRAVAFVQSYGALVKTRPADVKADIIWNVEQGWKLTTEKIARAEGMRTELYHRMRKFLERYEFLLCPVNQLPPFATQLTSPPEIAGVKMTNYLDWMKSCYYITITSHPAVSVPAGFTSDAKPLPVGLQIVGRYRENFGVLQLAHAFEGATGEVWRRRPAC